jgi:hypothetical protein
VSGSEGLENNCNWESIRDKPRLNGLCGRERQRRAHAHARRERGRETERQRGAREKEGGPLTNVFSKNNPHRATTQNKTQTMASIEQQCKGCGTPFNRSPPVVLPCMHRLCGACVIKFDTDAAPPPAKKRKKTKGGGGAKGKGKAAAGEEEEDGTAGFDCPMYGCDKHVPGPVAALPVDTVTPRKFPGSLLLVVEKGWVIHYARLAKKTQPLDGATTVRRCGVTTAIPKKVRQRRTRSCRLRNTWLQAAAACPSPHLSCAGDTQPNPSTCTAELATWFAAISVQSCTTTNM